MKPEIIILLIFFPILISLFLATISIAPWLPTRKKDYKRINDIANLKPQQTFCEIGSYTGSLTKYIGQKNPKASAIGIEKSLFPFVVSKLRNHPKNVTFIKKNAYKTDISNCDVIYIFGTDKTTKHQIPKKLIPKLKKNAKIISYAFPIHNTNKKMRIWKERQTETSIYEYI